MKRDKQERNESVSGARTSEGLIPGALSVRFLLVLAGLLALANVIDLVAGNPVWPITRHIDLGSDTNAAAWFSSILLAVGGLVASQCADIGRRFGQTPWFYLLALLLFGMSCDEIARLHETVFGDLAKLAGIAGFSFAQYTAWVWIGGPLVAVIFLAISWVMRAQMILVPGAMTLFAAGFAIMFLGGVILESTINFLDFGELKTLWKIEVIVEEALEMLGALVIVRALITWRDAWGCAA